MPSAVLALLHLGLFATGPALASPALNPERPPAGSLLLAGKVRSIDLRAQRAVIEVETTLDPQGLEAFHAAPISQSIDLRRAEVNRKPGNEQPKPRLQDVKPGSAAEVLVRGTRLGESTVMTAIELRLLESAALTPPPRTPNPAVPNVATRVVEPDGVCRDAVLVPMVFPVLGRRPPSDTWLAPRGGGTRRHLGQDIMAPQMTPLLACFDGTVYVRDGGPGGHYRLTIVGDNGWNAEYMHLNNDRPGTNDGQGGAEFAFAPGVFSGQRVVAGQLIGYNGNSGNAETTGHHLHFELWYEGAVYNAHPTLHAAQRLESPRPNRARPDERPANGEVRVDGFVQSFDPARRVLTVRIASEQLPGKPPTVPLAPTRRFVTLDDAQFLAILDGEASPSFADLLPNREVTVYGTDPGPGKAIQAKRVRAHLAERIVPPPTPQPNPQPDPQLDLSTQPLGQPAPPVEPVPPSALTAPEARKARGVQEAINAYRKRYRAADLRLDPALNHVAMTHARQMLEQDFLDNLPRGGTFLGLAKQSGFPGGKVALFVVGEEEDEWRAVLHWLRQTDARTQMLSPANNALGVGFVEDPQDSGNVKAIRYWVIVLGGP